MQFRLECRAALRLRPRDAHEVELPNGARSSARRDADAWRCRVEPPLSPVGGDGAACRVHARARARRPPSCSSVEPDDHAAAASREDEAAEAVQAHRRATGAAGSPSRATAAAGARWSPLGADAEAAHLRADRRDRRRADHQPARAARRRAQLGLPLHLDPRRRLLALRAAAARLHRGGGGVHGLADRPLPRVGGGGRAGRCRSCTASTAAHELTEEIELDHLEGYRGSRRCAIGNGAADQLQLDIYGELIDSVYLYNKYGAPISLRRLEDLCAIVDWLCENWDQRRRGHLGGARRPQGLHLLAADVLGRDRARDPHGAASAACPPTWSRWMAARDEIYHQIMERGLERRAQARSSSTTAPTCSTPRCC